MRTLYKDEKGIEPTVMKLLVGIVLVAIGLGIGVTMYKKMGSTASNALNYEITATPKAETITAGDSSTVSIDVNSLSSYEKTVELSATGNPEDVDISFSPESGEPSFGSTMTITVDDNASPGTHTVTIRGDSEDGEKSTTFELTIE